jgi:phosphatidate cytidylyltransferase
MFKLTKLVNVAALFNHKSASPDSTINNNPSSSSSGLLNLLRYNGDGSPKDRIITAGYILSVAILLTLASLYIPKGRLIAVAATLLIVAGACFEVVRLFARSHESLAYRPVFGVIAYLVLFAPVAVAGVSAVSGVFEGGVWWRAIYGSTILSGEILVLLTVLEGRSSLDLASRFVARFGVAFLIISVCAPALVVISGVEKGMGIIWWIVGCTALNDTAAYFAGRAFGRHKLASAISPNKTVEGSVAGVLVGTLAGVWLWRWLIGNGDGLVSVVGLSLAVVVAAQAGDLAKSYLKRIRGVKDMGAIFPGHGGVLDRFDALIAAAPIALLWLL